jgi:nitrate/TMAO reductase-like tetraheme cytochrome c subunit
VLIGGRAARRGAAGLAWTNTEEFCIGCHEMRDNVYAEFKGTHPRQEPLGRARDLRRLPRAARAVR